MKRKTVCLVAIITLFATYAYGQQFEPEENFRLQNYGNGVFILRYIGTNTDIHIPPYMQGRPVIGIGHNAFQDRQLTSVTIPNSVTFIQRFAFTNNQLTSVIIPDSVTSIEMLAFKNNNLSTVTIGSSVAYIGQEAFHGNRLTSVIIPDSVISIGNSAFAANQLSSVTIPDSVTYIGNLAFINNRLTSITIGNRVASIGNGAFANNQLTSVAIPNSVTRIGNGAFQANRLTSVTIPSSITSIGRSAFRHNQLTNVNIGNGVSYIGEYAFANNRLTSIPNTGRASVAANTFAGNQPQQQVQAGAQDNRSRLIQGLVSGNGRRGVFTQGARVHIPRAFVRVIDRTSVGNTTYHLVMINDTQASGVLAPFYIATTFPRVLDLMNIPPFPNTVFESMVIEFVRYGEFLQNRVPRNTYVFRLVNE